MKFTRDVCSQKFWRDPCTTKVLAQKSGLWVEAILSRTNSSYAEDKTPKIPYHKLKKMHAQMEKTV